MTPDEFNAHLATLALTRSEAARAMEYDRVTVSRWAHGHQPIPHIVACALRNAVAAGMSAEVAFRFSRRSPVRRPRAQPTPARS